MRSGPTPEVYAYLSYRDFLGDWYDARKAADARFSHRFFARRAGVRSPSLLNEVIAGRRNLTPITVEGFIQALGLDDEAAAFFRDLVLMDQATTEEERDDAWTRVAASRRFRNARPIDASVARYLTTWYTPAIREMALRSDFQADPAWIAPRMLPPITPEQAREALDTLLELGLLVEEDGHTRPAEVSLATPHEVAKIIARRYHLQMLDRARDALDNARAEERHFLGVTVAIPVALVDTLKGELDRFQERLLHLCDEQAAGAERVYQLNLNLVPLSQDP
ncbi:MAG: TIGR02147 family protein [Alphaproteobacteria bacterium]|nr:TIGR02147 family protein [Alphaproteobacteria bacterium]